MMKYMGKGQLGKRKDLFRLTVTPQPSVGWFLCSCLWEEYELVYLTVARKPSKINLPPLLLSYHLVPRPTGQSQSQPEQIFHLPSSVPLISGHALIDTLRRALHYYLRHLSTQSGWHSRLVITGGDQGPLSSWKEVSILNPHIFTSGRCISVSSQGVSPTACFPIKRTICAILVLFD